MDKKQQLAEKCKTNPMIHVDEIKALCKDFSSRTGSVYIKDVESALDALVEQNNKEVSANSTPTAWTLTAPDGRVWIKEPMLIAAVILAELGGNTTAFTEH